MKSFLILMAVFGISAMTQAQDGSNPSTQGRRHRSDGIDWRHVCSTLNERSSAELRLRCVNVFGLEEGQERNLKVNLQFSDGNQWVYFVDGTRISLSDLAPKLGQSYCAIAQTAREAAEGRSRIEPGIYSLNEISWYVNTLIFSNRQGAFVLYCSTVDRNFTNSGFTANQAIAEHLKGILE